MFTNLMNTVRLDIDELFQYIQYVCVYSGNAIVIEGEKHSTNNGDPNSSTVSESHHQKEQIIIENPNDPLSTITHHVEDVHVKVESEASTSEAAVGDKVQEIKGKNLSQL